MTTTHPSPAPADPRPIAEGENPDRDAPAVPQAERVELPGGWYFQVEAGALLSLRNPQGAGMGLWSRRAAEGFAEALNGSVDRLQAALKSMTGQMWKQSSRADDADRCRVAVESGNAMMIDVQEHRNEAYALGWGDGYAEGQGAAALAAREPPEPAGVAWRPSHEAPQDGTWSLWRGFDRDGKRTYAVIRKPEFDLCFEEGEFLPIPGDASPDPARPAARGGAVHEPTWKAMHQGALAALRMVREAVEAFGPLTSLESEEAVLLRGPEAVHAAEAIVDALCRLRGRIGPQPLARDGGSGEAGQDAADATVLRAWMKENGCTPSMMTADRDIWKARAQKAEAALASDPRPSPAAPAAGLDGVDLGQEAEALVEAYFKASQVCTRADDRQEGQSEAGIVLQGAYAALAAYIAAKDARIAALEAADRGGGTFQARNVEWMAHTFDGVGDPTDLDERRDRFSEEAMELIQATGGTLDGVIAQARYTFSRPVGDPRQEAGGTLTTLACLLTLADVDMADAGDAELARCWSPEVVEKVRRKRANRHGRGVLPGDDADLVTDRARIASGRGAAADGEGRS